MEYDLNALNSLLDGNTTEQPVTPTEPEVETLAEPEVETPAVEEPIESSDSGGDPSLESSEASPEGSEDEGKQQSGRHNAAMARMRIEHSKAQRTISELAKALGIQETDPDKMGDMLVNMAQEKLAKDSNIPVELYKELNSTKEQLAAVQYEQNQVSAKAKFMEVKKAFELDDKALLAFAQQLDNEGVNAITNPNVDLEYEYYKRNRAALEQKRINAAVEEALRKSNTAEAKSTKPGDKQGKQTDDSDTKINNVSALNSLLDGK